MKPVHPWFIAALLVASGTQGADAPKAAAEESPLVIDAATQKKLGIATASVQAQSLQDELRAPGEVEADAYATVLVSPRVPAQVVRRHAKLGESVKAGQPLVTLSSVEVAEAQGVLIVAERDWQRVKTLGAEAVSAKRYTEAQVARDQARSKLRAYGLSDAQVADLLRNGSATANGEFGLLAPQAGRVTTDEFLVGERVEPGRKLFTLIDESSVWVVAQFAPDVAERVHDGDTVRVVAHDQSFPGKVAQLSHRTQEGTRTTPIRIGVPNVGDRLHPGEYVEAFVATSGATQALAVPTEAIVQVQGHAVVFKLAGDARFELAPISAGESRGTLTVVKQGLAAGDVIAVKGVYALKARLLKSQLGEE